MQLKYTSRQTNNFDSIRLISALVVVLCHCHDLSLMPDLGWIPHLVDPLIAVGGFFAISGYLIVASYDRSLSLSSYLKKRARRILPAYWAALAFSLMLGATLSRLPTVEFWRSRDTWKYIFANLSFANFLHPSLPGLFLENPDPAVNGALWTIKIEVMFYLIAPAIAILCRRLGRWQVLASIFFLSLVYCITCEKLGHHLMAKQLPGQLCYFSAGSLVYYYRSWFLGLRTWMWIASVSSYIAYLAIGGIVLAAISIPLLVLCFAFLFPIFHWTTRYGDFSYGIYVFHFPIIQTLIAVGLFHVHPQMTVVLVFLSVAVIAVGSWNLIERPLLAKT